MPAEGYPEQIGPCRLKPWAQRQYRPVFGLAENNHPFRIDEAVESLARDAQLLAQVAGLGVTP